MPYYRCGGQHPLTKCKFKEAVCQERGHIVRVCRSKGVQRRLPRKTYYVEEREDQETPGDGTYSLFAVRNQRCDPILREVCINQVPLKMELDTGAAVSVITQWLRDLRVTLGEIHALGDSSTLQEVLQKHSKLFLQRVRVPARSEGEAKYGR